MAIDGTRIYGYVLCMYVLYLYVCTIRVPMEDESLEEEEACNCTYEHMWVVPTDLYMSVYMYGGTCLGTVSVSVPYIVRAILNYPYCISYPIFYTLFEALMIPATVVNGTHLE